jgi:hypothetical protein
LGNEEPFLFHAVEDRVEHLVRPFEASPGNILDLLNDFIAIILPSEENLEDNGFRGCGHERFFYHLLLHNTGYPIQ